MQIKFDILRRYLAGEIKNAFYNGAGTLGLTTQTLYVFLQWFVVLRQVAFNQCGLG